MLASPTSISHSKPLTFDLDDTSINVEQDVQCSFTRKTESAVCTMSENLAYEGRSTSTVTTKSFLPRDIVWKPATVTAGLSKFNFPQAAETPDAATCPHRPITTAAPLGAAATIAVTALFQG